MSKRDFALAVLALAASLQSASAQAIRAGTFSFSSSTTSATYCSNLYGQATGYVFNPGPGAAGTEVDISLPNVGYGQDVYIVHGFPNQPPEGLNGWMSTSPADARMTRYVEDQIWSAAKVKVTFAFKPVSNLAAQGTITITQAGCTQVFSTTFFLTSKAH